MAPHVAIFGGGVAGMSAAHELIERGFRVTVYEKNPCLAGGKARSIPVPSHGPGERPLPGEHGFRFFPGFYRHITDTMQRIPFEGNRRGVLDNLVPVDQVMLTRMGKPWIVTPVRPPRSLPELLQLIERLFKTDIGLEEGEREYFVERIWQLMTSCKERRAADYERQGWWQYVDAEGRSEAYQKILGEGLTRTLVAAKARRASTKTNGDILVQLLFNMADPTVHADRVLNAPTNEAWLTPWLQHLRNEGVTFLLGYRLERFECDQDGIIRAWIVDQDGKSSAVRADYFLSAVPVEVLARVLRNEFKQIFGTDDQSEVERLVRSVEQGRPSELLKRRSALRHSVLTLDPSLRTVLPLAKCVAWMNGLQIYLNERVDINPGHVIYADTPWALTSISQAQFWSNFDLSQVGNRKIRDVLSVDISDWDTPGVLSGRPAREATSKEEIYKDVLEQLKRSLNVGGEEVLCEKKIVRWYLDGAIEFLRRPELLLEPDLFLRKEDGEKGLTNAEPLLVNEVNTWTLRPPAYTAIPNLFLAADFVRTNTDLATMEAANEAARRAVNCILDASSVRGRRCKVWTLQEHAILAPLRQVDRRRLDQGLPWKNVFGG